MACVIVLGGALGKYGYCPQEDDFVIACDSGYDRCKALDIVPDFLIGDMDSIQTMPKDLDNQQFAVRKDDTDCILAIKEGFRRGYDEFVLLSGFGGSRTDHLFANLQSMLYIAEHGGKVQMCGEAEWCTVLHNGSLTIPYQKGYSLSVFAVGGEAKGVSLQGVSYPLHQQTLQPFFPLGISNFVTHAEGVVRVEDGYLLIFCSPMEWH